MNYTKPQVAVLGKAAEVLAAILHPFKPTTTVVLDGPSDPYTNAAYDLDE